MPMYRIRAVSKSGVISMTRTTDMELSNEPEVAEGEAAALFHAMGEHLHSDTFVELFNLFRKYAEIKENITQFHTTEMDTFWDEIEQKAKRFEV